MKINKTIILTVTLLTIIPIIGCSEEKTDPNAENTNIQSNKGVSEETTQVNYVEELSKEYNFDGYEFKVMVPATEGHMPDSGPALYMSEGLNGEVVNDAIFTRNQYIEDKLNININVFAHTPGGLGDTYNVAMNSIMANDYAFDLLIPHTLFGPEGLSLDGYLADWNQVDTINFHDKWWNQSAIEAFTIAGRELFAVSEFNLGNLGNTYGMFFNKDFVSKYGLEDPYQLVAEKKWTIDKMLEMTSSLYNDLNGNSKVDLEDQFGYSGSNTGVLLGFMYSSNITYLKTNEKGVPYYDFVNEKTNTLIDKIISLYYLDNRSYIYGNNEVDIFKVMQEGRLFLQADKIGEIIKLRDYDINLGILPYPLYDENQSNYLTYVDAWGGVLCLPINASAEELSRTGVILNALSYETMVSVKPKYYDIALKSRDARDEESSMMLDILYAGIIYDLGYIFCNNNVYTWLFTNNVNLKSNQFASGIASSEKSMNRYITNVYEKISSLDK